MTQLVSGCLRLVIPHQTSFTQIIPPNSLHHILLVELQRRRQTISVIAILTLELWQNKNFFGFRFSRGLKTFRRAFKAKGAIRII